jgi:hypothetical protein
MILLDIVSGARLYVMLWGSIEGAIRLGSTIRGSPWPGLPAHGVVEQPLAITKRLVNEAIVAVLLNALFHLSFKCSGTYLSLN